MEMSLKKDKSISLNIKKAKSVIDPRTLFLVNIIFSISAFIVSSKLGNHLTFVIALALMLMTGMSKKALSFFLTYGIIAGSDYIFLLYPAGRLQEFTGLIFYMMSKFIPIVMIASILVNKIKTNQVMAALEKMNIPKGIMISIVVSLRFIPTIREEIRHIKDSMSMRGLEPSFRNIFKKPILTLEYSIVPLLFRSLKIAEELTATALVRGVESEAKRSSYYDVSFTILDYLIIGFVILSVSIVFMLDNGVIKYTL